MARTDAKVVDSDTITIRVPIALRRRGGRKTVTTPEGLSELAPARARVDSVLVKALARAFRWRKLIETGAYGTVQEIADAEQVNATYVGRILRLTLLAPVIIEAILYQRQNSEITLGALLQPLPAEWAGQRTLILR